MASRSTTTISTRIPVEWYKALLAHCRRHEPPTKPATLLRWLIQQYLARQK